MVSLYASLHALFCLLGKHTVRCLAVVIGTIDCVHDAGRRPMCSIVVGCKGSHDPGQSHGHSVLAILNPWRTPENRCSRVSGSFQVCSTFNHSITSFVDVVIEEEGGICGIKNALSATRRPKSV